MTYKELRKIAKPHIREHDNLPSNSFLLLNQLHIPFGNEVQCEKDYKGKMNPLYNTPAFLSIKENGEKIVYFKKDTRYWNFYIFHEIAHYLLGHEENSPQNELDANLLACILAAPIENFPTTIKTAQDLSDKCNIPIDRAEEYWQEIKNIKRRSKSTARKLALPIVSVLAIIALIGIVTYSYKRTNTPSAIQSTVIPDITSASTEYPQQTFMGKDVVVTVSGNKYHIPDCRYVKNKTNTIEANINDAINDGYTPCKICIK